MNDKTSELTFIESEANIEHKLIDRILLLRNSNNLSLQDLELVIILDRQVGGIERKTSAKTLRMQPGQLLVLGRKVDTSAIVEYASGHALG